MSAPKQLTPWQPGQSGNPSGRPKAMLTAAIRQLITPEVARQLAEVVIRKSLEGEYPWMALLYDRLEGRPVQRAAIEVTDDRPQYNLSRATDEQLEAILQAARSVALPEVIEGEATEVEPV